MDSRQLAIICDVEEIEVHKAYKEVGEALLSRYPYEQPVFIEPENSATYLEGMNEHLAVVIARHLHPKYSLPYVKAIKQHFNTI